MSDTKVILQDTEIGTERWCRRCDDWWPFDSQFWNKNQGYCKACCLEMIYASRAKKRALA